MPDHSQQNASNNRESAFQNSYYEATIIIQFNSSISVGDTVFTVTVRRECQSICHFIISKPVINSSLKFASDFLTEINTLLYFSENLDRQWCVVSSFRCDQGRAAQLCSQCPLCQKITAVAIHSVQLKSVIDTMPLKLGKKLERTLRAASQYNRVLSSSNL